MNNNLQGNLFRTAAILYADNNYDKSKEEIFKKIIENALMAYDTPVPIIDLIESISNNQAIDFDHNEIREIAYKNIDRKRKHFILFQDQKDVWRIGLTENHRDNIREMCKGTKTIADYIEQFTNEYNQQLEDVDFSISDSINRFLYNVFTSNVDTFKRIFREKSFHLDDVNDEFNEAERHVVNQFLNWDNDEKNEAIFSLSSYAIEYCMLTNHSNTQLSLNELKNKHFCLDTNIIFRALGINGVDRKKRSLAFLNKFTANGQSIYVSKYTDREFKNTLSYNISNIRNIENAVYSYEAYSSTRKEDIFSLYWEYKEECPAATPDLFEAKILSEYTAFLEKMQIERDLVTYIPNNSREWKQKCELYEEEIKLHKKQPSKDGPTFDANNIATIEYKRDGKNTTIFDTEFFLISSDHSLQEWDLERGLSQMPVVMLPSQWLTIILRFVARSSDDFKSFVCFLNMKNNFKRLCDDKVKSVLEGISLYVSEGEQQKGLYNEFVNKETVSIIEQLPNDEVKEKAAEYAKSSLEKKMEKLSREKNEQDSKIVNLGIEILEIKDLNAKNQSNFEESETKNKQKITSLQKTVDELIAKEKSSNQQNSTMKEQAAFDWAEQKYCIRCFRDCLIFVPLLLLLLIWVCSFFFFQEKSWNYTVRLIAYLDGLKGIQEFLAYSFIFAGTTTLFGAFINPLRKLVYSKNKIIEQYKREYIRK